MKLAIITILLLSLNLFAQDSTMNVRDHEIKLGMNIDDVWDALASDFNVVENSDGNFEVYDNMNNPVCLVFFKNEKVIKIIKDWGTTYKTNAGQVFKSLWNILKEHEKDMNDVKIVPQQSFTGQGDKFNILLYIADNRYLDISIRFNVTILEILEEKQP